MRPLFGDVLCQRYLCLQSLDKAKDAGRKERFLVKQREQLASSDQVNLDLTYSVLFNLANQYACNEMYTEALNTYHVIVKNKLFSNAGTRALCSVQMHLHCMNTWVY